jgi:error-prone DNA polymerase
VPIIRLIARKLVDRSDLLAGLREAGVDSDWAERPLGRADEVKRPDPGSARPRQEPGLSLVAAAKRLVSA